MPAARDPLELNRRFWNEAVAIHLASEFYDAASFKAGRSALLPIEVAEAGDVRGKTLLHLQCHFALQDGFVLRRETRTGGRMYRHPDGRTTNLHFHHSSDTLPRGTLANVLAATRWTEDDARRLDLIP